MFVFPMPMLHWSSGLEHLHQCSVCDPALGILDEVHQSNPVTPLEDGTPKRHSFPEPWKTVESYWLTEPCFWLGRWFDWFKWVASSSLPPTCSPNFSFRGGVGKKLITKTSMSEYFCWVTYWALVEMLFLWGERDLGFSPWQFRVGTLLHLFSYHHLSIVTCGNLKW